ncbi:virulence factor [Asticcacaulis sp. AC460]|uniref:virulence factor n=1 Tax=Asticcacaulis sp. AC460 TaxID=1282360 RepID=UPI0003C3CE6A|nr:virulence factor [Asticcacaulis sp. AC460]ESQ93113.1 virulence factor [Asticcacaulis sp. AC460]
MFAIAFDLVVADTEIHHPKGVTQAYTDIGAVLADYDFRRVQGSLYVTDKEDMARLFLAVQALRTLPWFSNSVRDIRAFRVEQWSDFTSLVKGPGNMGL